MHLMKLTNAFFFFIKLTDFFIFLNKKGIWLDMTLPFSPLNQLIFFIYLSSHQCWKPVIDRNLLSLSQKPRLNSFHLNLRDCSITLNKKSCVRACVCLRTVWDALPPRRGVAMCFTVAECNPRALAAARELSKTGRVAVGESHSN